MERQGLDVRKEQLAGKPKVRQNPQDRHSWFWSDVIKDNFHPRFYSFFELFSRSAITIHRRFSPPILPVFRSLHHSMCKMLPTSSLHSLRFSILMLLSCSFAIAQQDGKDSPTVQEPAAPSKAPVAKAGTKSTSGVKSSVGKSKSSNEENDKKASEEKVITAGIELFAPQKMEMKFGMRFLSNDNYCTNMHATIPFPLNWPEQRVTVTNNQIPQGVLWAFRDLPAGSKQNALARQLVMDIAGLGPNDQLDLVVTVEIEKAFINAPVETSVFVIPKKTGPELRFFVGKGSPYIDHELGEVKRVAKQIAADNPENAWTHVERIYDWVRDNIEYRNGPIRHMRDTLKDKKGDCEEMTGLFVALCRASNIPARCVWVPEHCYPEFYLEDPQGVGHWFPCQVAGDRQFGQMHDYRPILQKGDRFKVPEETAPLRYVSHFFTCKQRPSRPGLDPSVEPILDLGPLQAQIAALRQQNAPAK